MTLNEVGKAVDSEIAKSVYAENVRWQNAIFNKISSVAGFQPMDGAGCESGDLLDYSLVQISYALNELIEQRDRAYHENKEHRARLTKLGDF